MKTLLIVGAVLMALGVMLGAFGAHGLKGRLTPEMMAVYQTAVTYHMWHGLGVLILAMLSLHFPASQHLITAGWLMLAGILLFSGSLYAVSLTGIKVLGAITPLGGLAFIAAWLLGAWSLLRASA